MPSANIRIYQESGTTLALVDEIAKYESVEFTRSRSGFGSFTITIGLDAPKASSFVKRYLCTPNGRDHGALKVDKL
jgi:hypothetical protein